MYKNIYIYFPLQFNIFYCAWHKTAELLSITSKYKIEFWGREGAGRERERDRKIEQDRVREQAVGGEGWGGGGEVMKLVNLFM